MKILIAGLKKNPQLKRLQEEAEKIGIHVEGCYASELVLYSSNRRFEPTLRGRRFDYDLISLMVSKRRWEWYMASFYLKNEKGVIVVNNKVVDPEYKLYITPSMNYYKQFKNKLRFPKSAVIMNPKSIDSVIGEFEYPLIVKASKGRQGRGVYKVEDRKELDEAVNEGLQNATSVILREFIPNNGDVRVFTVGFKAIGAMKRTPAKEGEFRSNISLGGKGERFDLDSDHGVREMAEKASRLTQTEIAGVDVMVHKETKEPYLLEVNPSPQFMGLEKYTDVNAAGEIISYFESLVKK